MIIKDGWRASGLLLHPSSLGSPYGVGDLGPAAHRLIPFLKKAGLHFWQVLPLTPTSTGLGNSPYSSYSAFAGNPLLVSPELMLRDEWLTSGEILQAEIPLSDQIDFEKAVRTKNALIGLAFERALNRFGSYLDRHDDFQKFAWEKGPWLNDYAFFMAAKNFFGGTVWTNWPQELKKRDGAALHQYGSSLAKDILREKFAQYLFFNQLREFKDRLREAQIGLIGDAAIYVNHDSADVWAQPGLFCLDQEGQPTAVAGVPPDYFAKDGQLWGNPLFNWDAHRHSGYDWWKNRLWFMQSIYDWVRLDHFRAFAAYWEVPAGAETAASGRWQKGPGAELFEAAYNKDLKIIAEDLGIITPDVTELRRRFGFPGMSVLQFAFGPYMGCCTHVPYRIETDNVVYSATHDNNTTRGWYREEADDLTKGQINDLVGYEVNEATAAAALIRLAWLSPGTLAVAPLQDILNLDERARFNTPGTSAGNWGWRLTDESLLTDELAGHLANLGALSGRDNYEHPNTLTY